jgi:hypothetical protein
LVKSHKIPWKNKGKIPTSTAPCTKSETGIRGAFPPTKRRICVSRRKEKQVMANTTQVRKKPLLKRKRRCTDKKSP